jgi:hypothetical protein
MIQSPKDIADAFASGRAHTQRFLKNAGIAGDSQWQDWAYASGQPAYDARIGDALTFTPQIATRNDAIWFPSIGAGQSRHLIGLRAYATAGGTGQLAVELEMYDLLGVYPLIDGDSTDPQAMDNTEALPRYASGAGVRAILVNHVAPALVNACPTVINYTDADDVSRSVTVYATTFGLGKAAFSLDSAGASTGPLYLPTDGRGVKRIDDITFSAAPGGLWAIYLVRPIERVNWRGGAAGVTNTVYTEKCLCSQSSFNLPQIYDGAHLGFFYMPNGSARTVALFGSASFIWG